MKCPCIDCMNTVRNLDCCQAFTISECIFINNLQTLWQRYSFKTGCRKGIFTNISYTLRNNNALQIHTLSKGFISDAGQRIRKRDALQRCLFLTIRRGHQKRTNHLCDRVTIYTRRNNNLRQSSIRIHCNCLTVHNIISDTIFNISLRCSIRIQLNILNAIVSCILTCDCTLIAVNFKCTTAQKGILANCLYSIV